MTLLISALIFFQLGARNDLVELRSYLGSNYSRLIQFLNGKNQILLHNTETLAPAQAAEMRGRMRVPDKLPADRPIVTAKIDNVGQGLASFLFEDDFITEQVNFAFCPPQPATPSQPARPERVMAIQVLLDDRRALGAAVTLLQGVYQLPPPLPPGADYQPVLNYPVRSNLPVTIWNLGTIEAIYQAIPGQALITGQLWLTDKTVRSTCTEIPTLTAP
ncbi:MAG TPA: hypothetical protein VE422_06660 [Terriglobia bacterium]|nr:hypothetical protein [Terriglobia bacterium]